MKKGRLFILSQYKNGRDHTLSPFDVHESLKWKGAKIWFFYSFSIPLSDSKALSKQPVHFTLAVFKAKRILLLLPILWALCKIAAAQQSKNVTIRTILQ